MCLFKSLKNIYVVKILMHILKAIRFMCVYYGSLISINKVSITKAEGFATGKNIEF